MKKILPYLLVTIMGAALIGLFVSSKRKANRQVDERFTLKRNDKIPYGTWAAYRSLRYVFPDASISVNQLEPGYWDSLTNYDDKQVLLIIAPRFDADREDLRRMMDFVAGGNHVFISTQYLSAAADDFFNCSSSSFNLSLISIQSLTPGLKIKLSSPPFDSTKIYGYPGRAFESYFSRVDTPKTDILGRDLSGRAYFLRMQSGSGFIYLHLEPFAFTNYFLLYRENIAYFENVMSLMPRDATRVVWDEYFTTYRPSRSREEKKSWFSVLMNMENEEGNRSFRSALLVLIGMLLVYVVMEMRRKQRIIPILTRPRNDSLDFVKTIGRLYFDKGDHKNLARKMSAYFLDYVRNKYKLATGAPGDDLVKNLSYKSGIEEGEIRSIVTFIRYAEESPVVREKELINFHRQLENFYLKA